MPSTMLSDKTISCRKVTKTTLQYGMRDGLKFELNANAPELVRRDPRLVLGQQVGEDPHTMDDAKMMGVETETHLQFPWVEDVVKMVYCPRKENAYTKGLGWVFAGDERFSH